MYDKSQTTGFTVAESLGRSAFAEGKGLDSNPFCWLRESDKRADWSKGWFAAREDAFREFRNNAERAAI